jgi:3-phosphoshikimate 1-carboxyvinyltransferase
LAALAEPFRDHKFSTLDNALQSEDTEVMTESLRRLGIAVETDWPNQRIIVPCTHRSDWVQSAELFCGNSGTSIRFLTAMLALGNGHYRLDGVARMRERPIQDLLDALHTLGASVQSESANGCPPVLLEALGLRGGTVRVRGDVSSQFLSGLLMAAPYAESHVTIEVEGELVSVPYVQMTLAMMRSWGVLVPASQSRSGKSRWQFIIHAPAHYLPQHYTIEPDASSASYFWGAAAITSGGVYVPGLDHSLQGDAAFRDLLVKMGCKLGSAGAVIGGKLHGIDVDMNAMSDTVMTLAVVALFAEGPTTIRNVAHIRHKETDRLAALATELRKVGAKIAELPDGLVITPGPLQGATLSTYNDHRMAMSLALIGLVVPGIRIENPGCVGKTYPQFWQDLEKLRE